MGANLHYTMQTRAAVADVSRSRRHRHRLEASARPRRPSHSDRLRSLPGSQGAAKSQLGGVSDRSGADRCRRPDPRAPRSLRIPAPVRRPGLSGTRVLHAGHPGPVHAGAAGLRAHSGRRRPPGESASITRSTARRCRSIRKSDAARALERLQPVGYDRPVPVAAGNRGRFHQRGPSAGFRVRARQGRTGRRSCLAATSAATDDRSSPIRRRSRRPTSCSSNRRMAIAFTSATKTASRSRASSATLPREAED